MSALRVLCRYRHKRRTQEAYGTLKPVSERFPEEWLMGYNMACYACQLGNQDEARHWLELAYKRGDKSEIRQMARLDPSGATESKVRGNLKVGVWVRVVSGIRGRMLFGSLVRNQTVARHLLPPFTGD